MQIKKYFEQAIKHQASDLYLIGNEKPVLRIKDDLNLLKGEPLDPSELKEAIFAELINEEQEQRFEEDLELDFAYQVDGSRFRVNLHWQQGVIALSARVFPAEIPKGEDIGFTDIIYDLCDLQQGLVLVTGPAGVGKSTTLAAMIEYINENSSRHIITIEDPIEYVFKRKNCIIEQREVGVDTKSFKNGLKYALRQDPDVVLLGEMRDLATIQTALTAAETGHLVLATLHTATSAQTVERIVDVFPRSRSQQILTQLSNSLKAVVSQLLLKDKKGDLVAVREVLINNPAIANLIRQNKVAQINSVIQTQSKAGMISMTKAIKDLQKKGVLSKEVAEDNLWQLKFWQGKDSGK